jgi:hypothetical protein
MRGRCALKLQRIRLYQPKCFFHGTSAIVEPPYETESPPSKQQNVDTRTYLVRKVGGTSLPLSPLMDPKRIAQRKRYRDGKADAPPKSGLTELQKILVDNPYGTSNGNLESKPADCFQREHSLRQFVFVI